MLHLVVAGVFLAAGFATGRDLRRSDSVSLAGQESTQREATAALPRWVGRGPSAHGRESDRSALGDTNGRDSTTTTRPERLRLLLAGDSVMAGLAPALRAALADSAEVRFLLTPSILRDATVRFAWTRELEVFDPDVVVMLVSIWEVGEVQQSRGQSVPTGREGWFESYRRDVLDPWLDLLTSRGAHVFWIGAPVVRDANVNLSFTVINQAFKASAEGRPDVTYVDPGPVLRGTDGSFSSGARLDDGTIVRTRQTDGLHLCPEGARLLAADLIANLARVHDVRVAEDWITGSWRTDPAYPADRCPPI